MQINFTSYVFDTSFKGKKNINTKNNAMSLINENRMVDSFINMAKIDSGSNEKLAQKGLIPSTNEQANFAKILAQELRKLNLQDINIDEHSIVTATFHSNMQEKDVPVIGLIAHMDTCADVPTKNVKPQIIKYSDGDIKLTKDVIIYEKDLKPYKNEKIITTNGKTLLGADDKAGIAEILEAIKVFQENPNIKHPTIRLAFTPDEETASGNNFFDVKKFRADFAYTIDGDLPAVIENETFNAFNPRISISGKMSHPGNAKGKMINSINVANWIISQIPKNQKPETTSKKQGYYHVKKIKGNESKTKIEMMIRDFDFEKAKERVKFIEELIEKAKEKFKCEIIIKPNESYKNMGKNLKEFPEVIGFAIEGIKRTGLKPKCKAVRGGSDGSVFSQKGLLTPNIGSGGINYHSKAEFIPISDMIKCSANIINIMSVWAEKAKDIMPKILARRL